MFDQSENKRLMIAKQKYQLRSLPLKLIKNLNEREEKNVTDCDIGNIVFRSVFTPNVVYRPKFFAIQAFYDGNIRYGTFKLKGLNLLIHSMACMRIAYMVH